MRLHLDYKYDAREKLMIGINLHYVNENKESSGKRKDSNIIKEKR